MEKPREKTRAEVWTIYRDRYRALDIERVLLLCFIFKISLNIVGLECSCFEHWKMFDFVNISLSVMFTFPRSLFPLHPFPI